MSRIMSDQPQMHFTKRKPVTVRPDRNITGKRLSGYVYRQGDDYMIIQGPQEAVYLARMGYDVELSQ